MENERLKIVTQLAAALTPYAITSNWSPYHLAQQAVIMADALIEVLNETSKPE